MINYNEKQLQIITAAEELFASKGFDGTSVRDIAQTANVNLAMISYYFGSKEKLLEAIFEYRIQSTFLQLETLVNDTKKDPVQKIDTLVDHYTEKFFNNQCFHKLMQREQFKHLESTELEEIIYKSKKRNFDMISQLVAEGQKKGVFKKKVDVSLLASTLIGTSNHVFFSQVFYKKVHDLKDMPEEEFQVLLKKKLRQHLKTMLKAYLTNET